MFLGVGEIRPGIFFVGSCGRDSWRATRKGDHPPKMAGSREGERPSCVGEDQGTPNCHGRIPIAILGPNRRENYGGGFIAVGRATNAFSTNSVIDPLPRETTFNEGRSLSTAKRIYSCS